MIEKTENYDHIEELGSEDVDVLVHKGLTYGSSWRNRGGVGAFMMLARKWDRIENQCKEHGYDVFQAIRMDTSEVDGLLDDLRDLRRYLFLVDSFLTCPANPSEPAPNSVYGGSSGARTGGSN